MSLSHANFEKRLSRERVSGQVRQLAFGKPVCGVGPKLYPLQME